jgi:hypothetical protein
MSLLRSRWGAQKGAELALLLTSAVLKRHVVCRRVGMYKDSGQVYFERMQKFAPLTKDKNKQNKAAVQFGYCCQVKICTGWPQRYQLSGNGGSRAPVRSTSHHFHWPVVALFHNKIVHGPERTSWWRSLSTVH